MAIWKRKSPKGLLWHSDRGSQYAAKSHRKLLKQFGIEQSTCALEGMSRLGNCWDNAAFSIPEKMLNRLCFNISKYSTIGNDYILPMDTFHPLISNVSKTLLNLVSGIPLTHQLKMVEFHGLSGINLLGWYSFSISEALQRGELRPLRNPDDGNP